jgi:hypothetical protein
VAAVVSAMIADHGGTIVDRAAVAAGAARAAIEF